MIKIKEIFKLLRKDTTPVESYLKCGVKKVDECLKGANKNAKKD